MKKSLFLIALLPSFCFSQEVVIPNSWSTPTLMTNDSKLKSKEIKEYRLYYSVDGPIVYTGTYLVTQKNSADITLNLPKRTKHYTIRTAVMVVDKEGMVSTPSNEVTKKVTLSP